ncbi:MAG: deoxycytidylate deaminase [bacterium]
MSEKWDKRFMELANHISNWSKDPSTKVGCVIVRPDRTIVSVGYNGFPRGVDDNIQRYEDREIKYLIVKHAEENAVYSAREPLSGYTAYVTHHPCSTCAGTLIQNGISRVVTTIPDKYLYERFKKSFDITNLVFKESGVLLDFLES